MAAKDDLLALLRSGGFAQQETGFGPFAVGSDGRTYSSRTARALEREGLAEFRYGRLTGRRDGWAFWASRSLGVKEVGNAG